MAERIGKYVLEQELAQGGMGAVWIAFDPDLNRRVAIKVLKPGDTASSRIVERFRQEALTIAQLHHPNVVQIHDFGVDSGSPFIVMERLVGEDLRARLARVERLPVGVVAEILNQAARALGAAHAAGIVHRDLKPANLFLARVEGGEAVKVLDFGVAAMVNRPAGDDSRSVGQFVGTPQFMSPEQASSAPFDHRTDLWSLAVVAYTALVGKPPFDGATIGALVQQICFARFVPPRQIVATLPAEIDGFFARALARKADDRFQSARELAAAFSALADTLRASCARILVVDDEPDVELLMRQLFRQQIRRGVYDFVFARSGDEGLNVLREQPDVDVVLSDINMPGMDGLTFLGRIGELNPIAKTVIVSAYADMPNIRTAMNRGAFDFLVKPIEFKDLDATLDKTVHHVRTVRGTLQAIDENAYLRLLVGSGIAERLLPYVRATAFVHAEREDATVAFVEVHGFSSVVHGEAPNVVLPLLNDYFEIIVPEVTAREGTALRFEGGAVMAVFRGAGHADRAIEACLAVRTRVRPHTANLGSGSSYSLGVVAGIDSGLVTFGGLGSKRIGRVEWTALSHIVGRAAHLRSIAAKDQVLIGEQLHRSVADAFDCSFAGHTVPVDAIEPAPVFNVLGTKGRGDNQSEGTSMAITGPSTGSPATAPGSARRLS